MRRLACTGLLAEARIDAWTTETAARHATASISAVLALIVSANGLGNALMGSRGPRPRGDHAGTGSGPSRRARAGWSLRLGDRVRQVDGGALAGVLVDGRLVVELDLRATERA